MPRKDDLDRLPDQERNVLGHPFALGPTAVTLLLHNETDQGHINLEPVSNGAIGYTQPVKCLLAGFEGKVHNVSVDGLLGA